MVLITDQATDGGFRSAVGSSVTVQSLAMGFGEQLTRGEVGEDGENGEDG